MIKLIDRGFDSECYTLCNFLGATQCYSGQGLPLALCTEITPFRLRGTVWDAKT